MNRKKITKFIKGKIKSGDSSYIDCYAELREVLRNLEVRVDRELQKETEREAQAEAERERLK